MRTTVQIGDKAVDMLCNGVTPILYKSAFHEDVLVAMTRKAKIEREDPRLPEEDLAKLTTEGKEEYLAKVTEYTEKMLQLLSDMQDTIGKLGHVMAMQAMAADTGKPLLMTSISENSYIQWLSEFENNDIALAMKDILKAYNLSSRPTSQPKN